MKNKHGLIIGFIAGALLGFVTIVILSRLHPGEDFAGIFIITLLCSGSLFALVGSFIQRYISRRKI